MVGNSMLQASDARPTFRTVAPLHSKALMRGKFHGLLAAITGGSSRLAGIDGLTHGKAAANRRDLGSRVVRIADIVASEDRSGDFDRSFNPLQSHTSSRWLSIAVARLNGIGMPAVELIQVGDLYAVRDGHHRISVARALGEEYIDAQVTTWELAS